MTETPSKKPVATAKLLILAGVVGLALGTGAIYGIGGFKRNADVGSCPTSVTTAKRIASMAHGQLAAMIPAGKPLSLAGLAFMRPDGQPTSLAAWKGRTVLLNIWATWCVPCRQEMPALDRLQAKLGSDRFEVVTVNLDTKDLERPKQFLDEIKVASLGRYADPTLGLFKSLQKLGRSRGLPTTLLVDADGCEIATVNGPAEWDQAQATALIEAVATR